MSVTENRYIFFVSWNKLQDTEDLISLLVFAKG